MYSWVLSRRFFDVAACVYEVALWFVHCGSLSTHHCTAQHKFHCLVCVWKFCPQDEAFFVWVCGWVPFKEPSFTFHFPNVKVGYNDGHWGAHDTAMFLSVETLDLFKICGGLKSDRRFLNSCPAVVVFCLYYLNCTYESEVKSETLWFHLYPV